MLDACSLIGLYATRRIENILASRHERCCVVDRVAEESGYVFKGGDGDDAGEREAIDIEALTTGGMFTVLASDDEAELLTFIDLALHLDEGEAMTGAVAMHRGFSVVTDDRKALRILTEHGVRCETTLDVIKGWADRQTVSQSVLRQVLLDLRQRARYVPHRQHHLRAW